MGRKAPSAPTPPDPRQTALAATRAQIELLPEQLAAEQEFAPQFAQLALDVSQQFGPELSRGLAQQQLDLQREFGPQFAEETLAQRELLTPEAVAGQAAISDFLGGGAVEQFETDVSSALDEFLSGEEVLTDAQRANLEEDVRQAQNVRGFGISSPLGTLDEIRQLEGLRQNIRSQRLAAKTGAASSIFGAQQSLPQFGLAALGRAPGGFQQFQPQGFSAPTPGLTSALSPQGFSNMASSNFATQAGIFRSQLANPQQNLGGQLIGGALGGLAGSAFGVPQAGASLGGMIGGLV